MRIISDGNSAKYCVFNGGWVCQDANTSKNIEDETEEMIKKDAVKEIIDINDMKIGGRDCDYLLLRIDTNKYAEITGGNAPEDMNIYTCLDKEYGLPLYTKSAMKNKGKITSIELEYTNISTGEVSDDVFKIPS